MNTKSALITSMLSQLKKTLRIFAPAFLMAILFAIIAGSSGAQYSRTRDENRHLVRGLMLLETGDYRLNKHHPIFANVMNAIPVALNENVIIPSTSSDDWRKAEKDNLAAELTEINGPRTYFVPEILNPARTVTVLFVAVSIVFLTRIVSKEWGIMTGGVFAFLYALEPNIIAHSSLVTTDGWIVPMIFGATYFLYKYGKTYNRSHLISFGIIAFLSLITKYSAIPVAALWILMLFIIEYTRSHTTFRFFSAFKKPLIIIALWIFALTAVYGFQFRTLAESNFENTAKTQAHLDNISGVGESMPLLVKPLQNAYLNLKLPFPDYFHGFFENVILHNQFGHDTYLFGQYSKMGWWYYFPATMLVKSPVPLLIGIGMLLVAGIVAGYSMINNRGNNLLVSIKLISKKLFQPEIIFFVVPLFLLFVSMKSSINLGYRHILPILPFIFLELGVLLSKIWTRNLSYKALFLLLGLWYFVSTVSIYPHYLAYFNEIAGGPKNGYKYLLDSNLSWDQDLIRVDTYIDNLPDETEYYKNPLEPKETGLVIYDLDVLMGRDIAKRELTKWIRDPFVEGRIKPVAWIGYSHVVFDLGTQRD